MSRGDLSQSNQELINFPEEWEPVLLKDVFNKVSIGSKKLAKAKYKKKGLYPVIDQGQNYISGYCDDSSKTVNVRSPVIVFGDHTCSVKLIEQSFVPGADGIKVLAVKKGCPYFFRYLLAFIAEVHPRKGYARHYHHLEKLQIRCPSIDVQKHISASIIKLERALERALGELSRVDENLSLYKQSVLIAAIRGKLVPQDPNDEPASELLKRIRAEKEALVKAKKIRKEKPLPPIDPDEVPFDLPDGWEWVRLGEVFNVYVGSTPSRKTEGFWNGSVPWVSSGEVAFCEIRKTNEMISNQALAETSCTLHPPNTILMGMIGEGKTRGQAAILKIPATHNQNTAAIRIDHTDCSEEYLYWFLVFNYRKTREIGSGNNQKALNKERIRNMLFPLAPISQQKRIANLLGEASQVWTQGLNEIISIEKDARIFVQSILRKAFEGELH